MRLIVVTDLDGTLLDHETYSHEPARPALERLRAAGVPVVLASSKTAAEMRPLQDDLGLGPAPLIVENGAGILWPGDAEVPDRAYRQLREVLDDLPEARDFRGFGDMSDDEVAQITGLPPEAARRARQRAFSEPGVWTGDAGAEEAFIAALNARGIHARRGGRFLTLSHGRTKGDAVAEVRVRLSAERVLALGDAPNDVEMLEAADRGVVVRNDHGPEVPRLAGEARGRIVRTELSGPAGWNRAVLDYLDHLNQPDGDQSHD